MWACHEPHLFQGWRGGSNLLARDLLAVLAWEPCHYEAWKAEAISSPTDRHTTFAMTTLNLPQAPCHSRTPTRFFAKPKCEPATSHTCSKGGVVEAIYLHATCSRFLPENLVIASRVEYTAWQSPCQFYTCPRNLSLSMEWNDRSNFFASNTCFFGITSLRS